MMDEKKICNLYDTERKLLDEYNNDINNKEAYERLKKCHEERESLMEGRQLSTIYENIRGIANSVTIDLLFEEAEALENQFLDMLSIYKHALEGCIILYQETGEKTIECKLHIVTCIQLYRKEHDCLPQDMNQDELINRLEDIFTHSHAHPLYGTYITVMLCDEYIHNGKKARALELFRQWASEHPLNSQSDIEVVNAWIEYSNLLGELGFYKQSLDNAENILTCLNEVFDGEMSDKLYFYRRISDIYISCSRYQMAIQLLEEALSNAGLPNTDEDELFNIDTQLAHAYYLLGDIVTAEKKIRLIREKLLVSNRLEHPSRLQFENIAGNIEGSLMNQKEHYDRMLSVYEESRKRYGDNNMDTVLYEYNLGIACFELYYVADDDEKESYIQKAQEYMEDAYERSVSSRLNDTLFALTVKRSLSEILAEKGDLEAAIQELKAIYESTKDLLTEDSMETADAAIRYGALVLEVQQNNDDVPEWIDEIDPELILKYSYELKKEYLGDLNGETVEALSFYTQAVQSNEIIRFLQGNVEHGMEHSWKLHSELIRQITFKIEQAAYIDSIEKQSQFLHLLEEELYQYFWLLDNSVSLDIPHDLREFYNQVAPYKNIIYDMQCEAHGFIKRNSSTEHFSKINVDQLLNRMRSLEGLYIDIWQEANGWLVFLIDQNDIYYESLQMVDDEDIPFIENAKISDVIQLDKKEYSVEEKINAAYEIARKLEEIMNGHSFCYKDIYLNLQKQITEFPIASAIHDCISVDVHVIASERELFLIDMPMRTIDVVDFMEKSVDYQVVGNVFKTTISKKLLDAKCALVFSGHGKYQDINSLNAEERNYVLTPDGKTFYSKDFMETDLSNLEIVMLPVCQSGYGRVYANFGIFGIGAACRIAGARATLETLWNVRSSASLVFEYEFFCAISEKHTITEAFWIALDKLKNYKGYQLRKFCNMLENNTQNRELRHSLYTESLNEYPFSDPVCWCGFVLIGGV